MIISALAWAWSVNDEVPKSFDLLAVVSHGARKNMPTRGAMAVTQIAREILIATVGEPPVVAFGVFPEPSNPEIEERFKRNWLPTAIFVGKVLSTIEECLKIRSALPSSFVPRVIVVVTDEAHSRRCRIVWRTFFPQSKVKIFSVPIADTVDKESPMSTYHKAWKILFLQAAPTPIFWWWARKGPAFLASKAGLHQPTTKT